MEKMSIIFNILKLGIQWGKEKNLIKKIIKLKLIYI